MSPYAPKTVVPVERTRAEIERLLTQKYGAKAFVYAVRADFTRIEFEMNGRRIRFQMPLPQEKDFYSKREFEQALRTKWRCLLLTIKGKLESVENEIETFDDAFLPQIVLPSNETLGEWARPQIVEIYQLGQMPPLLTA